MNRKILLTFPALAALFASCASVSKPPSAGATLVLGNTYVFRGVPQATDGVLQGDMHASVTDDADATYTITGWANMNLSSEGDDGIFPADKDGKVTEFDLVPEYSRRFGEWTAAVGFVNYNFPNDVGLSTTEVYAAVGHDDVLKPKLTIYYDIEEVEGLYVNAAISHAWQVAEKVTVEAGASLGYASERMGSAYWLDRSAGMADLVARVGGAYAITPHCSLTAAVYASTILDSSYGDALDAAGIDQDNVWVLIGAAWSF
ncbi:MAG: hypothetical protein JNN13_06670 [Planctomycetes bacterium]|nr:hypothetical protein [Planctomycetota bacterium]